jgi:hypothetical protein
MKKLCLALWAISMLATPASAPAAPGDRDRDGLPDRWERNHGLSIHRANANADADRDHVDNRNEFREGTSPTRRDSDRDGRRDGHEDSDGDGLSNTSEDRSGNDPRDPDSDDDGVGDADEHPGVVASFSAGRLTIALAAGGTLSAAVSEDTDIGCGSENEAELIQGLMDWDGELATAASAGDDDSERMDDEHDFQDACPARWLRPGVNVREASLAGSGGLDEVEFLFAR